MALIIKEYIGNDFCIQEDNSIPTSSLDFSEGYNVIDPIHKDSIMQDIEGIHVGPTRNCTWYTEEALDSSIPSWTKPYTRPLIMHHNDKDGKIIGRILAVKKITKNTRSGTPALLFTCNVPDKDGKEQILDGRLKTTSIGVIAHDVRCSICGEQIELDEDGVPTCGHSRGEVYDGQVCYWKIYKMEAKELSYVIVPSDVYAHNIRTYLPEKKDITMTENLNLNLNEGEMNIMSKTAKTIVSKESEIVSEEVKNDGSKVVEPTNTETPETKDEPEVKDEEEPKEDIKDEKDEKIKQLEAEIEKLKADKENTAKELLDVKVSLADATTKITTLTTQLDSEIKLKESMETEVINARKEIREAAEQNLLSLRTALNKPALKENLESRSLESIKDAIEDLKEELNNVQSLKGVKELEEAEDPTLKKSEKNNVDVKESNNVGNIDLEEGLNKIMSSLL